ncbi:MAG: DUF4139 domain-containing protein [Planctomycetota bacterium]
MSAPESATRPSRITFFEDRAEVTRTAQLELTPGVTWVRLGGVTPLLDDRSLRACLLAGAARVHATRVERSLPDVPDALVQAVHDARAALEAAQRLCAREEDGLRQLGPLDHTWAAALQACPQGLDRDEVANGWTSAHEALGEAGRSALTRLADARGALLERRRAYHDAEDALALAAGSRDVRARVAVQLEAERAGPVTVELTYRTPCASWRPEHLARLRGTGSAARLELVTLACAWQATQEDDWAGVELRFSTARPGRAAHAPELTDDVLSLRPRQERRIVVEARDEEIRAAAVAGGRRTVDAMPGVDDGGQPLEWCAAGPASFPSDGQPLRVELERREVAADLEVVAVPELATSPHLRARGTLSGATPLLAGPVRLAREQSVVGRGRVDFVGVGEAFTLGFGPEQAVSVRREVERERRTVPVIGTQKLTRAVTVYLSNLGDQPHALEVKERTPVSELEQITVEVQAPGWSHDAETGFLTRRVELGPRGTETLSYRVHLSAGSKVDLGAFS